MTQTMQLQRGPRQDVLLWAYPARFASYYERKEKYVFLFFLMSLEILLNLKHNLELGFLSIQKFDTNSRNTSISHGLQTFS